MVCLRLQIEWQFVYYLALIQLKYAKRATTKKEINGEKHTHTHKMYVTIKIKTCTVVLLLKTHSQREFKRKTNERIAKYQLKIENREG